MNKTAEAFWKARTEYPPVTHNYQRRYIDLGMVLTYIDGVNSILDLGCGEGQILLMLREITDISAYHAYDLSKVFIDNLVKRWGDWPGLDAHARNFTEQGNFPEADLSICMGVMLYIDDNSLRHMLSNIKSSLFICRVPCVEEREEINKFSEEYNDDYAAIYRTVTEYQSILSECFNIKHVDRCYPDEFESKYGSKQFFFVCAIK